MRVLLLTLAVLAVSFTLIASTQESIRGIPMGPGDAGLLDAAVSILEDCVPEAAEDLDDLLSGSPPPYQVVGLPAGGVLGAANGNLLGLNFNSGAYPSACGPNDMSAQMAATIIHELGHVNNMGGSLTYDPTTRIDPNATDDEVHDAMHAHAAMHQYEYDQLQAIACCLEAMSEVKISCDTLRYNAAKAKDKTEQANVCSNILQYEPDGWEPSDPECCDEN